MYKVGIIGLGRIACKLPDNHMNAYRDCPETRITTLCDIDKARLDQWGAIVPYTDYMKMVQNEKLDIVSVCTPPETHCEIVCNIAPYVKAIYCEKPIALTLEDADKMIDICHKYEVILQVNHQRRFVNPKFRFSRGILNTGTHMFDLIRYLFRPEIKVDIEEVDTEEPIFELDCTHNTDKMIPLGVAHLVQCLKENKQSISSGEEAREALRMCLEYAKV